MPIEAKAHLYPDYPKAAPPLFYKIAFGSERKRSKAMAEAENRALIPVRLAPRAGRDEIGRWQDGALRVRVAAPAVEGRANAALLRLLARALDTAPGRLTIVQGDKSRSKRIAVEALSQEEVDRRL